MAGDFSDLPLRWFTLEQAGQCSSRNLALQQATSDWILFVDDDDEIPADLIESHLGCAARHAGYVSCGVAHETGAGPLPRDFTYQRLSDVFPTNNTLIHRRVLEKSGLFDLAYEHGQRADGDLGMRIYLGGERMLLNPHISVLHHHAPTGGLRQHKARLVTYASSRQSYLQRHLASVSEIYLAMRYFTPDQVRELLWISVLGSFSRRGNWFQKALKVLLSLGLLPHTIYTLQRRKQQAEQMLLHYPQIPALTEINQ